MYINPSDSQWKSQRRITLPQKELTHADYIQTVIFQIEISRVQVLLLLCLSSDLNQNLKETSSCAKARWMFLLNNKKE
jgi:hypothetical protein